MLIFDSLHEGANGCLRVARIGNGRARISLAYRDNRGRAQWEFGLHDDCNEVSVRARPEQAQAVFDGLLQAIDPARTLGRPTLPRWVRHGRAALSANGGT